MTYPILHLAPGLLNNLAHCSSSSGPPAGGSQKTSWVRDQSQSQSLSRSRSFLDPRICPDPGHFWSRCLVPVPILVIYGPDDWSWSLSRFCFGPGTGPGSGPVVCLLELSYKKYTGKIVVSSKLDLI